MLEILGELIIGTLIGVLELVGDAVLGGMLEGFAKLLTEVWKLFAGYCSEICDWLAKLVT
jgi:hypothetical protein